MFFESEEMEANKAELASIDPKMYSSLALS